MSLHLESVLVDLAFDNDETLHSDAYGKMKTVLAQKIKPSETDVDDLLSYFERDLQKDGVSKPAMKAFLTWCDYLSDEYISKVIDFATGMTNLSAKNAELLITILKKLCMKSIASQKEDIYLKTGTFIDKLINASTPENICFIAMQTSSELFDFKGDQSLFNTNIILIKINLVLSCHKNVAVRKESSDILKKQFESCHKTAKEYSKYYSGLLDACKKTLVNCQSLSASEDLKLQEVLTRQCPVVLSFFGAHLKTSTRLTNSFLCIVEKGFCNPGETIRISAFRLWRNLIFYFSKNLEIISSEKYTKLFLQPLKAATFQNHSEKVTTEKIKTFWLLIQGVQQNVFKLFNTLCLPFLHLCLGGLSTNGANSPCNTSRRSSSGMATMENKFLTQLVKFGFVISSKTKSSIHESCQVLGAEAILHFLKCPIDKNKVDFKAPLTLGKLNVSSEQDNSFFSRYGMLFTEAANIIFRHLIDTVSPALLRELWTSLHYNVKEILTESIKRKKTETELFNSYFSLLRNALRTNKLSSSFCVQMLIDCSEMPESVLSSTFYGNSGSNMHVTPATTILSMMLIMGNDLKDENETKCMISQAKLLLKYSLTGNRVFDFLRRILEVFETCYKETLNLSQANVLLALWDNLALYLSAHVRKTQEINEGDAADHDYSTIYDILFIPFNIVVKIQNDERDFKLLSLVNLSEAYKSFLWADNFVTTSEPNEIAYELVSKIHSLSKTNFDFTKHFAMGVLEVLSSEDSSLSCTDDYDFMNFLDNWKFVLQLMLEDKQLSERSMKCVCNLFKKRFKSSELCISFIQFMPTWRFLLGKSNTKNCLQSFTEIVKHLHDSNKNGDEIARLLLDSQEWNEVLCATLQLSNPEIKNIIAEFYNDVIVKNKQHDEFCNKYSTKVKDILLPLYKEFDWRCPWEVVSDVIEESDDSFESKVSTNVFSPPKISYGVYNSPQKKSMLSPLKSNQSPKAKLKTKQKNVALKKFSLESKKSRDKQKSSLEDSESNEFVETPKKKRSRTTRSSKSQVMSSPKSAKDLENKKKSKRSKKQKESLMEDLSEEFDVKPLDESYEYASVVDMSVNTDNKSVIDVDKSSADSTNEEVSLIETDKGEKSTVSVNMVDMSCGQTFNYSDDLTEDCTKNSSTSTTSDDQNNEIGLSLNESDKSTSLSEGDCTNVSNGYANMVDMSCNVSLSRIDSTVDDEEEENYVEMVDMSCNPMANETTFESVNESVSENKENELTASANPSNIEENSLISEDRSYVNENSPTKNDSVFSNAHSTCNYGNGTSPVMEATDASPIVKSPLQPSVEGNGISPSSKSILKRKSFLFSAADIQTPSPKRRVSFAYPISESKAVDKVTSPKSILEPHNPSSPRTVSRKLSLPAADNKSIPPVPQSPLSLRSVKVVEAIADIRAKNGKTNKRLGSLLEDNNKDSSRKNSLTKKDLESMTSLELVDLIKQASKTIQEASNILLSRDLPLKSTT